GLKGGTGVAGVDVADGGRAAVPDGAAVGGHLPVGGDGLAQPAAVGLGPPDAQLVDQVVDVHGGLPLCPVGGLEVVGHHGKCGADVAEAGHHVAEDLHQLVGVRAVLAGELAPLLVVAAHAHRVRQRGP